MCHKGQASCTDVMGYHDAREIPNYWTYARDFVLQDHMFAPVSSWSLPAHLYEVSAWSAFCPVPRDPYSCVSDLVTSGLPHDYGTPAERAARADQTGPFYDGTDVAYLLHRYGVSWRYYVFKGRRARLRERRRDQLCARIQIGRHPAGSGTHCRTSRPCRTTARSATSSHSTISTPRRPAATFLPWPGSFHDRVSEHPPALITTGQAYVTGLINAIMRSPDLGQHGDLRLVG